MAPARRRPHPVRPLPARLPAARRPARRLLRPDARRRPDDPDHLRPVVRVLRGPGREEAAEPLLSRVEHSLVRHRGLQPRVQVLPEPRHLEVARDGHPRRPGEPGDDRARRGRARMQVGRVHLQRPGDLRRVRDGCRRRVPRPGRADGGGDRGLHLARRARGVLRQDGRGERRPEGVHRRVLLQALRGAPAAGARHARVSEARDERLVRDHDAAHSRARTTRPQRSRPSASGSGRSSVPTCRCTSPRSTPTTR